MAIPDANPRKSPVLDRDGMTVVLTRVVTTLYGSDPVPAVDGGWLFRAICEERRRNDDFFWTERRVHELARELGYWPWSVMQVHTAIRTLTLPDRSDVVFAPRTKEASETVE
jgi:hypothetical protein